MWAEQGSQPRQWTQPRGLRTPRHCTEGLSCQYHMDSKDTEKPYRGRSRETVTSPLQVPGISPTRLCKHCVYVCVCVCVCVCV